MEFGVLRQYFWEKTEGKTKFGGKRKKGRDGGLKNIDKLNNLMVLLTPSELHPE